MRFPRRDLLLVPLISLATALAMLAGAELLARQSFSEMQEGSCGRPDKILPYRYAANCAYQNKAAEGPLVSYSFNECGYRNPESCGPKPVGTVRIALLGASTAQGFKIGYEDSLAARAASTLSKDCGRKVEFQNMGVAGFRPIDQYHRVDEALALKPEVVMLVLTPYELINVADAEALANRDHPEKTTKKPVQEGANQVGAMARVSEALSNSRAALAAQYFLFQNRQQYVDLFLRHGDKADYLRTPLTPAWEKRLADLETLVGDMAGRLHAAATPFVIAYAPQRVQVALADPGSRPSGVDPAALGARLAAIASRHGIVFIDTFNTFLKTPNPEQLFFPVDGHMTAGGHGVTAQAITDGVLGSKLAAFAGCHAENQVAR